MDNIYHIFFSNCSKMKKIEAIIDKIAKADIPVLIKGESGTGKDLVAQTIHRYSYRREKPFIRVNCAAIPKGLLESELFGFEKGAFTGAHLKKPGKFELANGGTILLNEIGEIDIAMQAKLLQVLQDGEFSRLGGEGDILVNARVITTTKNHLENSMVEGRFREDLFFRINVMSLTLPPLRDRREQIPFLSQYFLDFYNKKYERSIPSLSSETMNAFQDYDWPGNIRELENVIKRVVIFGEEDKVLQDLMGRTLNEIKADQFDYLLPDLPTRNRSFCLKEVGKEAAAAAEREVIKNILDQTHWNRKEAAKLLRVSYKALLYKIQKYHIDDLKIRGKIEEGTG